MDMVFVRVVEFADRRHQFGFEETRGQDQRLHADAADVRARVPKVEVMCPAVGLLQTFRHATLERMPLKHGGVKPARLVNSLAGRHN
jgi:hypothetical protein